MSAAAEVSPCPRCGQPVSTAVTTSEPGQQLAAPTTDCPSCGVSLVRDIDGPADRGWRVAEDAAPGG